MLDIFKKNFKLVAPISGKVMELSQVPDEIFSQKMAGDGIAIDCTGDVVVAPANGTLSFIFKSNHAFGMHLDNGIEIMVHVGLDTVGLAGQGFQRLVQEGQTVKVGEPIIKFDRKLIIEKGCSLISPVLIINAQSVRLLDQNVGEVVEAGEQTVLQYKIK